MRVLGPTRSSRPGGHGPDPSADGTLTGTPVVGRSVSDNRSLDEFAGAAEEVDEPEDDAVASESGRVADDAGPEDDAASAVGADAGEVDDDTIDPATSTYTWSPAGGECAACGSSVEERWRDGDDLVCLDCKKW